MCFNRLMNNKIFTCGYLNENAPHKLMYFNNWSLLLHRRNFPKLKKDIAIWCFVNITHSCNDLWILKTELEPYSLVLTFNMKVDTRNII